MVCASASVGEVTGATHNASRVAAGQGGGVGVRGGAVIACAATAANGRKKPSMTPTRLFLFGVELQPA